MRSPLALLAALVAGAVTPAARAADAFAWTPRAAPSVVRGRETAARFDLLPLHELTVEVDNAFAPTSREALAIVEQRIAEVPGVRRVVGPARVLAAAPAAASDDQGEAVRQRLVRRADALGWFLSADGRLVRLLIDTDDPVGVRPGVEAALAGSGLGLVRPPAGEGMQVRALWPDPRGPSVRWLPGGLAAAWVSFVLVAVLRARGLLGPMSLARSAGVVVAAAVGAATAYLAVPVGGVRSAGVRAAAGASLVVLASMLLDDRLFPRRYEWRRAAMPPAVMALLALAAVVAALALGPRVRVATHLWDEAPLMFASVRGDMDEPVALREVRRLTDFLRAQPGVASAWSVADLISGTQGEGEEASRIPDDADQVRRLLVQARNDPAVALELSADHREALVGIRFDEEAPVDRAALVARVRAYLGSELRPALERVDLRAAGVGLPERALAKGMLAIDARERVSRICARSGRALTPAEAQSVERVARQAAILPAADPLRLRGEMAAHVREIAARQPAPLDAAAQARLTDDLVALSDEPRAPDVRAAVAVAYDGRLPPAPLAQAADTLQRRAAIIRRRLGARLAFKEMLYGADLPTEGVLADEVRGATLEAMGPVAGIPVAPGAPGALRIDAAAVGGAANDDALSEAWQGALGRGVGWGTGALAALLLLVGGVRGLTWLPVALAPAAVAVLPAALLREPMGLWTLAFVAGALAAGSALAASLAARRSA